MVVVTVLYITRPRAVTMIMPTCNILSRVSARLLKGKKGGNDLTYIFS